MTKPDPLPIPEVHPAIVQKLSISQMETAWAAFIRNAKTAKGVMKAEIKEHFIDKPKAVMQELIDDVTADQSTITVAGEFDFSDSESDSDDYDESDSDSDDEEPIVTTRKSLPSYLKANMRDFSFQPYVHARPPPAKLIYGKRQISENEPNNRKLPYEKRETLYVNF